MPIKNEIGGASQRISESSLIDFMQFEFHLNNLLNWVGYPVDLGKCIWKIVKTSPGTIIRVQKNNLG